VTREEAVDRLRVWAARAQNEAEYADTADDRLHWQGQAQVLSSVATFVAGPGLQMSDEQLWQQVASDRSSAFSAWERTQEGPEAMLYAGMVAGYDVAVTTITDAGRRTWDVAARGRRWVNR
jgi:hypothetical protein